MPRPQPALRRTGPRPVPNYGSNMPLVSLAVNNNFLFGSDGVNLYSYSIAVDGSITEANSIDVRRPLQFRNPRLNTLDLDNLGSMVEYAVRGPDPGRSRRSRVHTGSLEQSSTANRLISCVWISGRHSSGLHASSRSG